jgi:hypothetical protein
MTPVANEIDEGSYSGHTGPIETRVERGFETSRLEGELLALAYERVVPVRARASGMRAPSSPEGALRLKEYDGYMCGSMV